MDNSVLPDPDDVFIRPERPRYQMEATISMSDEPQPCTLSPEEHCPCGCCQIYAEEAHAAGDGPCPRAEDFVQECDCGEDGEVADALQE